MDNLKSSIQRLADMPENEIRVRAVEDAFAPFGEKLEKPGRALVGEGILTKVCKKKLKKRAFFLFTDVLIYGTIILHKSVRKYTSQQIFELCDAHVESIPDCGDITHAFNVFSPKKSFTLMAVSSKEKQDWITHLEKCIMFCNGGILPSMVSIDQDPNVRAPVWISDNSALSCMCCNKKFTVIIRRHHCRSCGRVICSDCSKGRFILPNIGKDPCRVCDVCLVKLQENEEKFMTQSDDPVIEREQLPSYDESETEESSDSEAGDGYQKVGDDDFLTVQQGSDQSALPNDGSTISSYINRISTFYGSDEDRKTVVDQTVQKQQQINKPTD